jgi:transcription antitermination factor NusG
MLKFKDNPSMLPAGVASVTELQGDWWVAHTKARNEKSLAHDLSNRGVGYYLPMVERVTFSGKRKRRGLHPLFTSYVFICGGPEQRYIALATGRVCQIIPVTDRDRFVAELANVQRALACHAPLELYRHAVVGRRCRIAAGPFEGITGTVIQSDHRTRLVLSVAMLGQGASLEIDTDLLEPVE